MGDGACAALTGIPYGLKDVICTAGVLTTGQSKILQHHVPQRDAEVVARMKQPGGAADFTGRVVARKRTEFLGQNVVVEGRPGAGGVVASEYVTKPIADGYTPMLTSSTTHGAAPVLYKKLPYDAMKGFTHICGVSLLPAIFEAFILSENRKWGEIVRISGAAPD